MTDMKYEKGADLVGAPAHVFAANGEGPWAATITDASEDRFHLIGFPPYGAPVPLKDVPHRDTRTPEDGYWWTAPYEAPMDKTEIEAEEVSE